MDNNESNGNAAVQKYLKSLKRAVGSSSAQKREALEQLETDVLLYAEDHEITDVNVIVKRFGSPEEIAKSFVETSDAKDIKRLLNNKRRVIIATCIVLAVVLVAAITVVSINAFNLWRSEAFRNGYYVETITDESGYNSDELHSGAVRSD